MTSASHRVVRNAGVLYARTAVVAALALLTSRLVIGALGSADYGLLALMIGVVGLMSFVNAALAVSAQRHLGIEIGRGAEGQVRRTFTAAVAVHTLWALGLLCLAETVGLWALREVLQIPPDRQAAAFWVYQCTVLTAVTYVMAVPSSALLAAHEALGWVASLDVVRATLVLGAALALPAFSGDALIFYAVCTASVTVGVTLVQILVCRTLYGREASPLWRCFFDRAAIRQLAGFSGWTLFGAGAFMARLHGVGLLLNLYFGVAANAAYGICLQVNTQVSQLTQGVFQAGNPRILLLAGAGRHEEAVGFCLRATKYAAFLAGVCVIPVLVELPTILVWWLKTPPEQTAVFCRVLLVGFFLDQLSFGLGTLALATGRLARYQLLIGGLQLVGLPLAWMTLRAGLPAAWALAASAAALVVAAAVRPWVVAQIAGFPAARWFKEVLWPLVLALLPTVVVSTVLALWLPPGLTRTLLVVPAALAAGGAGMYLWGMTPAERRRWRDGWSPQPPSPAADPG